MSQAAVPSPETELSTDPVLNQFYQDYWRRLLRFVREIVPGNALSESRLDAEGVVQDTFTAAFKTWTTIEHPERWIYIVAARKVRQHARQEWLRDRELQLRLRAAHTHVVVGSIVDQIMALPTNHRIVTYLRTNEKWTAPEIAKLLDIARATAHVHVRRNIHVHVSRNIHVHVSRNIEAAQRFEDKTAQRFEDKTEFHGGITPLSGSVPGRSYGGGGGSYRLEYRISIPRLLVAVALGLLLIAAIAGLVWFVFIFVCGIPATWVIGAIAAILTVAGMSRLFR